MCAAQARVGALVVGSASQLHSHAFSAIVAPPEKNLDLKGVISIKDNDSLAARLAVLIKSDLLLIMSDVDGLFNSPPHVPGSRLLHSFNPKVEMPLVNFGVGTGDKSKVGTGGMAAKVQAATWAVENNCSVVICNGGFKNAITDIIAGKKIGTHFSTLNPSVEVHSHPDNEKLAVEGKYK